MEYYPATKIFINIFIVSGRLLSAGETIVDMADLELMELIIKRLTVHF